MTRGLLSLAGGLGVGAALMYLFDPEAGRQRRERAKGAAGHAWESASETLGDAYETTTHALGDAWQSVSESASDAAAKAKSAIPASLASIPSASDAQNMGRRWLGSARESARSMIPRRRRPTDLSATSASAIALGCLAAGVGAMWLFDPSRGRGRRAWLMQKGNRIVNETGRFMRATGRHVRNKARGYYHEAVAACDVAGESGMDTEMEVGEMHPTSSSG